MCSYSLSYSSKPFLQQAFLDSWIVRGLVIIFSSSLQLALIRPCWEVVSFVIAYIFGSLGTVYFILGCLCVRQLQEMTINKVMLYYQCYYYYYYYYYYCIHKIPGATASYYCFTTNATTNNLITYYLLTTVCRADTKEKANHDASAAAE